VTFGALVDTGAYCLTVPAGGAIEQCGVVVDLVGHRLVPVPHLDMKPLSRAAA
jgi:hypothetical protein